MDWSGEHGDAEKPAGGAAAVAAPRRARLARALAHRNFRLFFAGQGVSLLGTWMQQVALGWLVYRLTQDAFLLGLVSFMGLVPGLLLLPIAGVLLDRNDRYRLVLMTQVLAMVQAVLLAVLTLTHLIALWQVLGLAFVLGCVNAFDLPARQALLPALVPDRADLTNAIALNSSLFNGARLVGPAAAGLVLSSLPAGLGEGVCFAINAGSYLAVLLALLGMTLPRLAPAAAPGTVAAGLAEGVRHAWRDVPIRSILLLVAWVGFIAMPYTVLMPVVADRMLGGDRGLYGLLLSASGVGALAGAVYLATRRGTRGAPRRIAVSAALAGLALLALTQVRSAVLALPLLVLIGLGMMLAMVSCSTIVQTLVPDDKRARVMSLFTLAFMGLTPFGSLLIGAAAEAWTTPAALAVCGAGALTGALLFALNLGKLRGVADARSVPGDGPAGGQ